MGINNALKVLDPSPFPQVRIVSHSTTLATNSIMESKGARVGSITAVPRPESLSFSSKIPAEETAVIAGVQDHRGQVTNDPDISAAGEVVSIMREISMGILNSIVITLP